MREWTAFDDGLLYTLWVVAGRLRASDGGPQPLNPPFVIDRARREEVWSWAPFELREWAAPGDGTYQHHSSMFFASGRAGLSMSAAMLAFTAAGNRRRRRQADQDAVPRWLGVARGTVWPGNLGFWLETVRGLLPWPWQAFRGARVISQGVIELQGESADGPMAWQVETPAAELMFAMWVLYWQVPHPQWMDRTWIPPNWMEWATKVHGKSVPVADPSHLDVSLPGQP